MNISFCTLVQAFGHLRSLAVAWVRCWGLEIDVGVGKSIFNRVRVWYSRLGSYGRVCESNLPNFILIFAIVVVICFVIFRQRRAFFRVMM